MKVVININEVEGNAVISFESESEVVEWKDLADEQQAMIINALYNFTNVFQRNYIDSHLPEFQKVPALEDAEPSTVEEQ